MSLHITPPKLTKYQQKILDSKARFTITEASTKIGKTFSHLWWLFKLFCTPPKRGANYWWIAPTYSQAKMVFNRLRRMVEPTGHFRINESELYIENKLGARIWFKTAERPDNLYGEDVFGAVFDEFTRGREEAWIALRSTLTHTKAPCKFIGNVKGKKNWGYRLGLKARNGTPDYEYFKVTALDAVSEGILDAGEIAQAKLDLPDHAFRELYMAEALDDMANPFGMAHIRKQVRKMSNGEPRVWGIDLAKSVDWTVCVALDDSGDVCRFERWQSDWGQTRRRIISLVGMDEGLADSTGVGDPIVEDIVRECPLVEPFTFTQNSKQKLMEGLAASIQNGEVGILEGLMYDELESFEFIYSRTGHVKYSAPEGLHDDIVCALALAVQKFKQRGGGVVMSRPF